ncbi:helix-turn-helix transcriptional regulator [Streptosporangium sp. 'caverna']|uniref:helix-turn-helix transcriptional regulator n=1 Tax=Streptosporangium sp. 'caverna' TaxID=2202249 RepID=UPI000D7E40A6|nr:helix-turn-helix transcriptional regulator [Streptosporangium sp. 'caverna']AWS42931.1 transcriptional regulator [Streptosporangium sp. 'caverna']
MDGHNLLGEFLRARRQVTTPEQVGLLRSGYCRTPGLRREEVARLAGVSTDYYIRLEQGRERHPSDRVLDALVRALDLCPEATTHLYELAHPGSRQRGTTIRSEQVNPDLIRLMHGWSHTPAMVISRWMDVLAMNPLSVALHSDLGSMDNLLRLAFLNPAAREFHRDWEKVARSRVAHLRAFAGADLDDPRLTELVGELSRESTDFRRMWARHDVSEVTRQTKPLRHREVGDLTLTCEMFNAVGASGLQLVILHAEPGSPSEHALTKLGSLAVTTALRPGPRHRPREASGPAK